MVTIEYLIDAAFDTACDVWSKTGVMKDYWLKEATAENCDMALKALTQYILDYNEGLEYCGKGAARISLKRAQEEAKKVIEDCIEEADSGKSYIIGDLDGLDYPKFMRSH